ncbi:hypothetical protein BGX27_003155 [Mortierella sp. AM989]|nr:hypothetical protein BGX27_003155 [Mortierella sp. AM989]
MNYLGFHRDQKSPSKNTERNEDGGSPSVSVPIHPNDEPPAYTGNPNSQLKNGRHPGYGAVNAAPNSTRAEESLLNYGRNQDRASESRRQPSCLQGLSLRLKEGAEKIWRFKHNIPGLVIFVVCIISVLIILSFMFCEDCFYTCRIPENAQVIKLIQSIDPNIYNELKVQLDVGITGNIFVTRSKDIFQQDIIITTTMKASTPRMLKYMTQDLVLKNGTSRAESSIFMNMTNTELKQALKRNCTLVDVEIAFPRQLSEFGTIEIHSLYRGTIQVVLDEEFMFDRFLVRAEKGNVNIKDAVVKGELNVMAKEGSIEAIAAVKKVANLSAKNKLDFQLASKSSELDVRAISHTDRASVVLTRRFYGHFSVMTTDSRPELLAPTAFLMLIKSDNHTLYGYISEDGWEPWCLPRLQIRGSSAKLELQG